MEYGVYGDLIVVYSKLYSIYFRGTRHGSESISTGVAFKHGVNHAARKQKSSPPKLQAKTKFWHLGCKKPCQRMATTVPLSGILQEPFEPTNLYSLILAPVRIQLCVGNEGMEKYTGDRRGLQPSLLTASKIKPQALCFQDYVFGTATSGPGR